MPPAAARSTRSRSCVGLGDPDAAPAVGGERPVRFRLDVGEQRRRPRSERPVREAFLPADPGATRRVRAEDGPAAQPAGQGGVEGVVAQRGEHPDRQATTSPTGARTPGTTSPARGPARAAPGRGRRRRRATAGPAKRPRSPLEVGTGRSAGCGASRAASPPRRARPRARRRVTTDDAAGGVGGLAVDPRRRQGGATGEQRVVVVRPEAPRDGRAPPSRDRRPSASDPSGPTSQPWPSSQASGSARRDVRSAGSGPARRPASRRRTGRPVRVASAAPARWRCASVSPGIATSSGSSAIRSVNGSARVSRSTSEPAKAIRPSRMPIASTQPNPLSPASVAIRPVMSIVERHDVRPPGRPAERPARRGRARHRARARARRGPSTAHR